MRSQARVVIVGGGVMGIGLLYDLALEGWTDAILVEKGELTSGSTWHAAGQCPSFIANYNLAKVHAYSNDLYARLEAMTGEATGWHATGRHPVRDQPARAGPLQAGRGRGRQHRLPDAGHQPRGDPADQPVRDHRGRAGRRLDPRRRLRGPVERLQRDGEGRPASWAARSSGTTASWASSACATGEFRVSHRAGRHHLRARRQRRRLLRGPGQRLARRPDALRQHEAPVRGHGARPGVPGPRRRDPRHARPVRLRLLPAGAEVRPDRDLRGRATPRRRGRSQGGPAWDVRPRAVRGRSSTASCRTSSGSWSGCRSSPTRASSGSSTARSRTRRTATRWSGRPPACATSGSPPAPGSASPRARAAASTWPSGWSTATPRSTCWAWTRAGSAPFADQAYASAKAHREYWDMYRLDPARRGAAGGPAGEGDAAVRDAHGQGLRVHRGLRLGAAEVVLARRARGGRHASGATTCSRWWRPSAARSASASASWSCRASPRSRSPGAGAEAFLDRLCANRMPRRAGGIVLAHALDRQRALRDGVHDHAARGRPLLPAVGRRRPPARPRPAALRAA